MYDTPVKSTVTGQYGCEQEDEDCVIIIEEFIAQVKMGAFIDYDGFGYPVKDKLADESIVIKPSRIDQIPKDATHIVWYNR